MSDKIVRIDSKHDKQNPLNLTENQKKIPSSYGLAGERIALKKCDEILRKPFDRAMKSFRKSSPKYAEILLQNLIDRYPAFEAGKDLNGDRWGLLAAMSRASDVLLEGGLSGAPRMAARLWEYVSMDRLVKMGRGDLIKFRHKV